MHRRAILIVLDGVGIGEMRDSYQYGDQGSNSLKNTADAVGGLKLPNLQKLGLGNIDEIMGVDPIDKPAGAYGKMEERSCGKDSTVGHWEMMGLIMEKPFPTYPQGFPADIIDEFERAIGRKTIGNKVASGTEIINDLGEEHIKTGYPIVYTSADSVFQIAAHEEVVPVEQLYQWCSTARQLLLGDNGVGRVIARPFVGDIGCCTRTSNRHDYSLEPGRNVLDILLENQRTVIGVGKIKDLFAGRGLSESYPTRSNQEGILKILELVKEGAGDLIFANLLDFDQTFGHRNDVSGYAAALTEFDQALGALLDLMRPDDLLFITADHGNDPTTPSTDHSREYVPLLVYGKQIRPGIDLGIRSSFCDLGHTIASYLGVSADELAGESFCELLR
ncbi:phosphopentomutase [hydrocarbon metagenome]|uniref:Phosphopentomutase n=1 Tax=hydrocarbon metagenome TaxID=938273 RepID=A0A0W8E807_9ZZZZ